MEYKVVQECFPEVLDESVNEMIEDGWEPLGGASSAGEYNQYYIQAMVRKK